MKLFIQKRFYWHRSFHELEDTSYIFLSCSNQLTAGFSMLAVHKLTIMALEKN